VNVFVSIGLTMSCTAALFFCELPGAQGHRFNVYAMTLYVVADTIWVMAVPTLVKTPKVIIVHHLVTLACLSGPLNYPDTSICGSMALLVEANTALIVLRRRLNHPIWIEILWYITWLLLRVLWYPLLTLHFAAHTHLYGVEKHLKVLLPGPLRKNFMQPVPPRAAQAFTFCFFLLCLVQMQMTYIVVRTILQKGFFAHTPYESAKKEQ